MTRPDLMAMLGSLPSLFERVSRLEKENVELREQLAHLAGEADGEGETLEAWAARTGRSIAAAHKAVQREERRPAAQRRFTVERIGRELRIRTAGGGK